MRAFRLACTVPWAIEPSALRQILEIAARENLSREVVEAQLGRKLDNTHTATMREGVATIPVEGPLFRRADFFTQVSGATAIDTLATDLRAALDDASVGGILLSVDSPGGEVNGVQEFADMVYAARREKPIWAYISDLGASAAYWIASAASEVAVAETALAGSIGAVIAVRDSAKDTAKMVEFVSSQSPRKRLDPHTETGKGALQVMVDDLADVFVATVARNRGVSVETVLSDFGAGGLLIGSKAASAGLVDRVSSYEATHAALVAQIRGQGAPPPRTRGVLSFGGAQTETARASETEAGKGNGKGAQVMADETTGQEMEKVSLGNSGSAEQQRIAALEAELARQREVSARHEAALAAERDTRITAELAAFVDTATREGRLMPAEREAALSALALAAGLASAESTPQARLAGVKALISARPPHVLTQELVNDSGLYALANRQTTDGTAEMVKAARDQARAWGEEHSRARRAGNGNGQKG